MIEVLSPGSKKQEERISQRVHLAQHIVPHRPDVPTEISQIGITGMYPEPDSQNQRHTPKWQMVRHKHRMECAPMKPTHQDIPEQQRKRKRHGRFFGSHRQQKGQYGSRIPYPVLSVPTPLFRALEIQQEGQKIQTGHEPGSPSGEIGHRFGRKRMNEKKKRGPKRD